MFQSFLKGSREQLNLNNKSRPIQIEEDMEAQETPKCIEALKETRLGKSSGFTIAKVEQNSRMLLNVPLHMGQATGYPDIIISSQNYTDANRLIADPLYFCSILMELKSRKRIDAENPQAYFELIGDLNYL